MASIWSSRNFSGTRDAVLVNGLSALAGCTGIMLATILDPNDQAFGPGLGVALAATGVLLAWSLTLAVRAWRRGERSGWCWAVMVLGGLEAVLLGTAALLIKFVFWFYTPYRCFQWACDTGVIVFLPVGMLAYLGAVPVTWWRLRRAARQIRGHDPISGCLEIGIVSPDLPHSHWKRGLVWFYAAAMLLIALLLPCPLFLHCCYWHCHGPDHTWRTWVVEHTPVFVADPAAGALKLFSHAAVVELYDCALRSGRVSKNRLLTEVNSGYFNGEACAFDGLTLADPQAALALGDQIGQTWTSGRQSCLPRYAGRLMGERGTLARIRYFFNQAATQSPPSWEFMCSLLSGLCGRPEFLPELASFCRKDSESRGEALQALASMLPPKDLPRDWQQSVTFSIRDRKARLAIIVACFESRDPPLHQDLQEVVHFIPWVFVFHDYKSSDPALTKELVQFLLPILDDADGRIRCYAAGSLSMLIDGNGKLQRDCHFFDGLLVCVVRHTFFDLSRSRAKSADLAPEEQAMLESTRAAAEQWFNEHK
ncbi:MAG: hypothetical protein ABSE73_17695 [Planctomycetota bacterium]